MEKNAIVAKIILYSAVIMFMCAWKLYMLKRNSRQNAT